MIYFVQAGEGAIKIGFSDDLVTRFSAIRTSCPLEIVVLGVTEGTEADERALHKKFRAHRVRGEWFNPAADLLAHIEAHASPYAESAPKTITNETGRFVRDMGGNADVAREFGTTAQCVWHWVDTDHIPHKFQVFLVRAAVARGVKLCPELQRLHDLMEAA